MSEPGPFGHIHPEDQSAAKHAAARAFWTGVSQVMRYRLRGPDGKYRWSETRMEPPYCPGVSDALVTELELTMSSEQCVSSAGNLDPIQAAKVVEVLFGNAWAFDAAGRWTYLPLFAQTTLGKTLDDLNGSVAVGDIAWKQLLHPEDYESVVEKWTHCLRTGDMFNAEFRIRRKNGFAWARSAARAVFNERRKITGWYGTSIDIDVYRKTVAALQERENSLSHLVDLVPCHLWRLNADGEPTFFNRRMIDYLGWDITDADEADKDRLDAIFDTIHLDEVGVVRAALGESLATGQSFRSHYRVRRADGVYRWKSVHAEQVKDQDGRVVHWYGICLDIDDQIRSEEARQLSERHLQRLVDTLPISICSWTADGQITYGNKTFVEGLGTANMTFEGLFAANLARVHPTDVERVRKTVTEGLRAGDAFVVRYRRHVSERDFRTMESRFEPRLRADGTVVEWSVLRIDVDDEVRLQEALSLAHANLARASQAASLAELSASIAHEIAQPLAAVSANSDAGQRWLSMEPPNVERALKVLERIQLNANRAIDVVTRIRALFKHSIDGRTVMSLRRLVDDTCGLLAEEAAHRRVRVEVKIENDLPPFAVDHVQIQQVLINLIRNGMQAMEAVEHRILEVRAFRAGKMIQVEISDTGPGIEAPGDIFQPFITTKSEGLGMGLAICRSIVEAHCGRLWAEETTPNGAKFVFTLPVNSPAQAASEVRTSPRSIGVNGVGEN